MKITGLYFHEPIKINLCDQQNEYFVHKMFLTDLKEILFGIKQGESIEITVNEKFTVKKWYNIISGVCERVKQKTLKNFSVSRKNETLIFKIKNI